MTPATRQSVTGRASSKSGRSVARQEAAANAAKLSQLGYEIVSTLQLPGIRWILMEALLVVLILSVLVVLVVCGGTLTKARRKLDESSTKV